MTSIANVCTPAFSSAAIRSTRRATAYVVKPASCSRRAVSSPMPLDAPVTRATRSVMAAHRWSMEAVRPPRNHHRRVSATARSRARVMSATVAYPARSALEPGRTGSAEFTLMQRRVPPSATFCRATAWPVVPEPAKKSSTTASAGIVCSIRRTRPVGFGDSKTWPTIALSSATAVSVEPTSSASQIVRSFFRRPPGPSRCSQSFWNTSTRSPSRPLITRQTRSSGRCSISGARPPPHRRAAVAEHRLDLDGAVEGGGGHAARHRVAVHREVQGARGDGVELLVGVAQRQVPVRPPVRRLQREVRRVDGLRAAGVEHAAAGVAGVREQVLVRRREPLAQLAALGVEVDDDLRQEVGGAEDLVHQQPQPGLPRCRRC